MEGRRNLVVKKIVLNFSNITQFNEQFKLVEVLKGMSQEFEIVFLANDYSGAFNKESLNTKITSIGIKCFLADQIEGVKKKNLFVSLLFKLPKIILNYLETKLSFNYAIYLKKLHESESQLKAYSDFLNKIKPNLLIVSEDGPGSNIHLIKAAKLTGLKTMILPYEYSGVKQMIIGAVKRYTYKTSDEGLKKDNFEKYYFKVDDKYCGFYSKEEILAYTKTTVLPSNVKTVHGGIADKIASESLAMTRHYLKEGLPTEKIALTGSINDDILFSLRSKRNQIKSDLYELHGLDKNLDLIVFSFIPEYPDNKMYGTYAEYIREVSATLRKQNKFNVVYQFHPSVPIEQRKFAWDLNLIIADNPTIELIAIADLYITSYSSTIRWAIASSVPVIHLDLYGFDYDDFKESSGIKFVKEKSEFNTLINELVTDYGIYNQMKINQEKEAEQWGINDGNSTMRIIDLINSLCQ